MQKVSQYEFFTSDDVSKCNAMKSVFYCGFSECVRWALVHDALVMVNGVPHSHINNFHHSWTPTFLFSSSNEPCSLPVVGDVDKKKPSRHRLGTAIGRESQ